MNHLRALEINGGSVSRNGEIVMTLPAGRKGYADAQIDDTAGMRRRDYIWRPGTRMAVRARMSHPASELQGTAGFGFWNTPFGDPRVKIPALPKAVWFFFASKPNVLPFAPPSEINGWFMSCISVSPKSAALLLLISPALVPLSHVPGWYRRLWPRIQKMLQMNAREVAIDLTDWHHYELSWEESGCRFHVDGELTFASPICPDGPLGFVSWIDNQYLIMKSTGKVKWGTLDINEEQFLELADLRIEKI